MENENMKANKVLSHIIKARYFIKDKCLYSKEYRDLVDENHTISDVSYCAVKNVTQNSIIMDNRVLISINFDLIAVYEICGSDGIKKYETLIEKPQCIVNVEKKYYEPLPSNVDIKSLECENFTKNVQCSSDIDSTCKIMTISVMAAIDSMLVQVDIIDMANDQPIESEDTPCDLLYKLPITPLTVGDEDILDANLHYLNSVIRNASAVNETNKKLEEDAQVKDTKIAHLEYKISQLQNEYNKTISSLKDKELSLKELASKLEKCEETRDAFQNSNSILNQEMKVLLKENESLKLRIDDEENKKKNQIGYKIKSAISNIKLFSLI